MQPRRSHPLWRLWPLALVAGAVLAGGWVARASSLRPGPPPGPGVLPEGASAALAQARREQALIRAEATAAMLQVLEAAPTLPGGSP